jgi:hypothetical protein
MAAARFLRCFALVLPVALFAVGCTGSDATPNLSPVSSAPTSVVSNSVTARPSASSVYPADVPLTGHNVRPGEKPPVYPAAAQAHTQDGANAFAEFFMKTLDWAYATTNPSYMKHYYGPTCGLCSGIATGITKTAAEHHWYEGGRLRILSLTSTEIGPVTAPVNFCSVVVISTTAQTVVDGTGKIFNGAGASSHLGWKLCSIRRGETWRLNYFAATS